MALVFSLRKGQGFFVGDNRVVVSEILSPDEFKVDAGGTVWLITDRFSTMVLKDVYLSSGDRGNYSTAQVAIDAPRSLKILRDDAYRKAAL